MTSPYGSTPVTHGDEQDVRLVEEVKQQATPFMELGVSGLKRTSGYIDEEFLPALKGKKAVQVYREMGDNSAIIGALLFSINQLVRNAEWQVVPAGKGKEHADAAKLLETAKDDMSHSWDEMVTEAMSCVQYGWAWHEIVYKRRMSPWDTDGRRRSKYTDGLVGWRKMPLRSQETLHRWAFDDTGSVQGMIQLGPPDYKMRVLPIERSLLFRYGQHKGNPEGRSILRNAYQSWHYLKRIQEFEAIGVERDLAGLPVVKVPAEWLRAPKNSEQGKQVEAFKKMVRGIRRNEQEGIVFPTAYDPETKQPMFNLELLGSGGARQFQTGEIITRYKTDILMTVLADFIMVGHQRVGSYNLHLDKTGIFRTALNALLQQIADTINRHAVPRLFLANGWKPAELPYFQVTDVDAPDIAQLSQFLTATAGLGFNWGPDADLEKYLRRAAGLPEIAEDDYKKHRQSARRVEATRFATEQTEYLAARSMLAQQMAQQKLQEQGLDPESTMQANAAEGEQQAAEQEQGQQAIAGQREQEAHQMSMQTQQVGLAQQLKDMTNPGAAKKPAKPAGK